MPRDRPTVPQDVIFFDFVLSLGGPEPYFLTIFCEFQCVVLVGCCMVLVWCGASAVAVLAEGIGIYKHIIFTSATTRHIN